MKGLGMDEIRLKLAKIRFITELKDAQVSRALAWKGEPRDFYYQEYEVVLNWAHETLVADFVEHYNEPYMPPNPA